MISDQIRKRRNNQYALLHHLHFYGASQRMALSAATGIRKNSVTDIIRELLASGIIEEQPPGNMRSVVALAPAGCQAAVAAVFTGRVVFSTVDMCGTLGQQRVVEFSNQSVREKLPEILLRELKATMAATNAPVPGCGVAFPGVVDAENGICRKAVNIGLDRPLNLRQALAELGCEVTVENDVRAELWSCVWFGETGQKADNLLYLGIHDGLGAATLTRGQLNAGQRFMAGEIGHIRIDDQGKICSCGKKDCLECYCSGRALLHELRQIPGVEISSLDEFHQVAEHPGVLGVLEQAAGRLAGVLAGVTALIDPQAVIIGTPATALSGLLAPRVGTYLNQELAGIVDEGIPCYAGDSIEEAALKGAAGLVFEKAFLQYDFSRRII